MKIKKGMLIFQKTFYIIRFKEQQGATRWRKLRVGEALAISPTPELLLWGTYGVSLSGEHFWIHDAQFFVGLLPGMGVFVEEEEECPIFKK